MGPIVWCGMVKWWCGTIEVMSTRDGGVVEGMDGGFCCVYRDVRSDVRGNLVECICLFCNSCIDHAIFSFFCFFDNGIISKYSWC